MQDACQGHGSGFVYWSFRPSQNYALRKTMPHLPPWTTIAFCCALIAVASSCLCDISDADEAERIERYEREIEPLLADYCFACHGYGSNEGSVTFDEFESNGALLNDLDLWRSVLRNLRADIMPPEGESRPTSQEERRVIEWIKSDVFQVELTQPDPGRSVIRRLNRVEYQNTIRDLMGVEFKAEVEFPPDDSGYGFDNIADVLTVSPLLLEKYLQAAQTIVAEAVPETSRIEPVVVIDGSDFKQKGRKSSGRAMSFYEHAKVRYRIEVPHDGDFLVDIVAEIDGTFDFDPGRCRVIFRIDDEPQFQQRFEWHAGKPINKRFEMEWKAGEHWLEFELEPLVPIDRQINRLNFSINTVEVRGPRQRRHWLRPENYDRFFHRDAIPDDQREREVYAREIVSRFGSRAFRRPVDAATVDRLVQLALSASARDDQTFENGIARAITAMLASPRFLFRVERTASSPDEGAYPLVDEYALASRLSYFLWSTMPDDELFELASQGQLRQQLASQVERMIQDRRSDQLVRHFVGQWLQTRDIDGVPIDPLAASGVRKEYEFLRETFFPRGSSAAKGDPDDPELQRAKERIGELRKLREAMDGEVRTAMRDETEMTFAYVIRNNRSILELIDSDYTFLNERLASHYGIEGVSGEAMRRVELPSDSPRGGVLTQGTFLAVTSNPTRTSPVKRGLFILDNILGTPSPPPPGDVPELEDSLENFTDHEPTLREVLELHRQDPLCNSCHARFDPLGIAFENLNALGRWRETENDLPIDASGQLITGETFQDVRDLKRILSRERHADFYRCLTEQLLTYAIGRGLEYYDEHTVDRIVDRLEDEQGRFAVLLDGIIDSAPFQKRRE